MRLLLRDETDAGVAGAQLLLRTENGQMLTLTTDASGVVVSNQLTGKAVWLMSGQRADGTRLVADSYPADAGFRLVLIPGHVRDALLRLDGDRIVLDPDMIFSPEDPSAPQPTPPQFIVPVALLAPVTPQIVGTASPSMPPVTDTSTSAVTSVPDRSSLWLVLAVVGGGALLIALALLIGLVRRRQA